MAKYYYAWDNSEDAQQAFKDDGIVIINVCEEEFFKAHGHMNDNITDGLRTKMDVMGGSEMMDATYEFVSKKEDVQYILDNDLDFEMNEDFVKFLDHSEA